MGKILRPPYTEVELLRFQVEQLQAQYAQLCNLNTGLRHQLRKTEDRMYALLKAIEDARGNWNYFNAEHAIAELLKAVRNLK